MSMNRRQFIGLGAAAVSAAAVAPGVKLVKLVQAKKPEEAVTNAQRWGLLIDTAKCQSGCSVCVDACFTENGIPKPRKEHLSTDAQWIRKLQVKDNATGYVHNLPMLCQHCEKPPCVDVCPTGASFKREDGIVLVDKHICIGCRYCMMACPYKARSFIHEPIKDQSVNEPRGKGTVESCTLCNHRIDANNFSTACADACIKEGHQAILFGDLKDKSSEIYKRLRKEPSRQIRSELNLNTGVRYQNI
jgi:[DsrC]-trisulfide reductase subunit O